MPRGSGGGMQVIGQVGGREKARERDVQGTPTQSHVSPRILVYVYKEYPNIVLGSGEGVRTCLEAAAEEKGQAIGQVGGGGEQERERERDREAKDRQQVKSPLRGGGGGVPQEQKILKGHLPRFMYHQVYWYTTSIRTYLWVWWRAFEHARRQLDRLCLEAAKEEEGQIKL